MNRMVIRQAALILAASCAWCMPRAQSGKFFGCIWQWSNVDQAPQSYTELFNQATPENAGKWGSAEWSQGNINWQPLDAMFEWAERNNTLTKQHCFVWAQQQPGWLGGLSQDRQRAAVADWIGAYIRRYGDKLDMIDVVNEPHQIPSYANALGGSGETGFDWLVWSFQTTRDTADKYAPNAKLILNIDKLALEDYCTEDAIKW
jgi:endo-1,4-beta-xylanase